MREPDDIELQQEWEDRQHRALAMAGCACFPSGGPGTCPGRANCPLCQPDDEESDE
jgi:hypothetical protein